MSRPPEPPAAARKQQNGHYYLWDSCIVADVDEQLFDPRVWARSNQLIGTASGRGAAYFLRPKSGVQWVLRHSRRGGLIAHFNHDSYLWLGRARCRVFREWFLLANLHAQGLPVPAPVAARVLRRGLCYRSDLITQRVAARPLADWLAAQPLAPATWHAIGATICRFHHAGVDHHDLNARNILVSDAGAITLIDFDQGRVRRPDHWRGGNLMRLRRSLDKIAGRQSLHFSEQDWAALQSGYAQAFA